MKGLKVILKVKNNLRVIYNYILVRLGIRSVLPSECIKKVKVLENHDKLVRVDLNDDFVIADELLKPVYLRKTVYDKLREFSKQLKSKGLKIKLYDAYRSYENQERAWNRRYAETKKQFPDLSEDEIERRTRLKVSKVVDKDNVGGHQTGGAIDITLVDENMVELNMGTKYSVHNNKTKTKNPDLTEEERDNRNYLVSSLEELGFVNFPNEWWHFCYGDKMWAAYKFKKTCMYGYIEPNE